MARTYWGGSGNLLTAYISVAASMVLIFYGYDQVRSTISWKWNLLTMWKGVFGNILVGENFLDTVGNPSVTTQGNLVSFYNLGCFAGAIATMWIGDILGRPKTLVVGSAVVVVGAILQCAAFGLPQMLVGRIVAGLGTGMNTSTAGVWQAETSKMRSRGKMIAIQMTMCAFGLMVSNWLTLGFSFSSSSIAWRFPLAFQILFAIIIFVLCPGLPDSPRLLIRKSRHQEAREVLAALAGEGATADSVAVLNEFQVIKDVLDSENMNSYTWRQLALGHGPAGVIRRMILGAGMQAMNQLCGINIIAYYATYVFIHGLGFSSVRARVLSAGLTVDFLVVAIISIWLIERQGRRRLMIWSCVGMASSWIGIAVSSRFAERHPDAAVPLGIVSTTFFFLMFAFFGVGFDPVTWVYPSEINALETRTKGASLAMATNWILNFMIAEITPSGVANLGWRFWLIWATITAAFVPIVYFFYPETANRSLEDVDRFFQLHHEVIICNNNMATKLDRPEIFSGSGLVGLSEDQKDERTAVHAEGVASIEKA